MEAKAPFRLKVATPCRVPWAQMTGDDKVRFCGKCQKNVYNLSTMTRDEAVGLVRAKEGEMCANFYQRPDGTVLTSDCPVGVRRARFVMAATFSLMVLIFAGPVLFVRPRTEQTEGLYWESLVSQMRRVPLVGDVVNWLSPEPVHMGGAISVIP